MAWTIFTWRHRHHVDGQLWLPCSQGLSLRTFNIHDGRGLNLLQAIRAVQLDSFDAMLLTETKITNQDY